MGRRTVCCSERHTPLCPKKMEVRRNWLSQVPLDLDVVSISHGFLDAANMVLPLIGWHGRVACCDIDPGVRETLGYLRQDNTYPLLNLQPVGSNIIDYLWETYVKTYSCHRLGVVDLDLAEGIVKCWDVLGKVIQVLQAGKFSGKVYLTFRNGRRDGFGKDALENRLAWLDSMLPKGVKRTGHTKYNSAQIDRDASRTKGASMCIVELSFSLAS